MGIKFFEKNKIDLDKGDQVTITVTDLAADDDGQDYVDYLRDRKNDTGWATTGSSDAANTTLEILFGESHSINALHFIGHNWKAYICQYWNGSAYTNFSTAINVSGNTSAEKYHTFDSVETDRIKIIITHAMVVNDDKYCSQIIVTELIGTLTTQPLIERPQVGKNRRTVKALSGKKKVQRGIGAFSFRLKKQNVIDDTDLTLMERLYDYHEGFLVWLCGDDITQFRTQRIGYRRKDLFLMNIETEYQPEWGDGRYQYGNPIDAEFVEVI